MGFLRKLIDKMRGSDLPPIGGGDGHAPETAATINCSSMSVANLLIDRFISKRQGKKGTQWNKDVEFFVANPVVNGQFIRCIGISVADGTSLKYYFDVSRPMGASQALLNRLKWYSQERMNHERQSETSSAQSTATSSAERRNEFKVEFERTVAQLREADERVQMVVGHGINLANSFFTKEFKGINAFKSLSYPEKLAYIDKLSDYENLLHTKDGYLALGAGLFKMWVGALAESDGELLNQFSPHISKLSEKGEWLGNF